MKIVRFVCCFCQSWRRGLNTNRVYTSDKEMIEQYKKRMELGDAQAIYNLGCWYYNGRYGLPQDHAKALELWHRAAELGSAKSYYNIGN